MIEISKIFHFEAAHALFDYKGACANIHGHSYRLTISVSIKDQRDAFIPAPGIQIDYKVLKKIVGDNVLNKLDHALLLSELYIQHHPYLSKEKNIFILPAEPSTENLMLYIRDELLRTLPEDVLLSSIQLQETEGSFATWSNAKTVATKD